MTYVSQKLRAIRLSDFHQFQILANPKLQRFTLAFLIIFPELPMFLWYCSTLI